MQERMIQLNTFADGAIAEQFEIEFQKVLMNLADPNTDPFAERTVTITFKIKGDDAERETAKIKASVTSKIAPQKEISSHVVVDVRGNIVSASELVRKQSEMEFSKVGDR